MKITAISPYFNINKPQSTNKLKNVPACDVFVRSCSFKGDDKSFEAFSKWAKETDFIEKIPEIINYTGKILGSGFEGTTYDIPNNDKWVLKEFKRASLMQYHLDSPQIIEIEDISPDLNIGQFIAYVRIPTSKNTVHQVYVLKRQNGESCGLPYCSKNLISDSTTKLHINYLKNLSSLPQSSYDKLIDDITYVTEQGYKFDCSNPYNFMLDMKNKQINFVDIADKFDKNKTQYGEVLYALLDAEFAENFNTSNRKEKDEADIISAEIFSKFICAMKRKKYHFTDGVFFNKVLSMLAFTKFLDVKTKEEALEKLTELGLYCK